MFSEKQRMALIVDNHDKLAAYRHAGYERQQWQRRVLRRNTDGLGSLIPQLEQLRALSVRGKLSESQAAKVSAAIDRYEALLNGLYDVLRQARKIKRQYRTMLTKRLAGVTSE